VGTKICPCDKASFVPPQQTACVSTHGTSPGRRNPAGVVCLPTLQRLKSGILSWVMSRNEYQVYTVPLFGSETRRCFLIANGH